MFMKQKNLFQCYIVEPVTQHQALNASNASDSGLLVEGADNRVDFGLSELFVGLFWFVSSSPKSLLSLARPGQASWPHPVRSSGSSSLLIFLLIITQSQLA